MKVLLKEHVPNKNVGVLPLTLAEQYPSPHVPEETKRQLHPTAKKDRFR